MAESFARARTAAASWQQFREHATQWHALMTQAAELGQAMGSDLRRVADGTASRDFSQAPTANTADNTMPRHSLIS